MEVDADKTFFLNFLEKPKKKIIKKNIIKTVQDSIASFKNKLTGRHERKDY